MAKLKGISELPYGLNGVQLFNRLDSLLGSKQSLKVGNNTELHRTGRYSDIALTLHGTDVVTLSSGGSITLNSGRWRTITTKERMNQLLNRVGYCVYQKDWDWYVAGHGLDEPYSDGFILSYQLEKIGA